MIPVNQPSLSDTDIEAVNLCLRQTMISGDTQPIRDFEQNLSNYLGVRNVVTVSSGTTALDLAVEAFEIGAGDQCLVPSFTIISTVSNLLRRGARVKVVDADPSTWSMDSREAASLINISTKLVVPVHIYGLPVDMDPIKKAAEVNRTPILEDAAEALGVTYKSTKCGNLGDLSVFSFYANKIITGGEGGAVATNNDQLADKIRSLRNLAFNPTLRFVHESLGWNARWNGLSATLANSQLKRIDDLLEKKRWIAEQYIQRLHEHPWFEFQPRNTDYSENAFWVVGLLLRTESGHNGESFQKLLRESGIDSRRFFCPIHLQPLADQYRIEKTGNMKVSEKLWESGVYLPSGLALSESDIEFISEKIWSYIK